MNFKYIDINKDTVSSLSNKFNDNFNELAALNLENLSGENGISGLSGISGISGTLGSPGNSGRSGISGLSGSVGLQGMSGDSGLRGISGISGSLGLSGISGRSGISGLEGQTGPQGISGLIGISGDSNGQSGISGLSGISGTSSLIPLTLMYQAVNENPLISTNSFSVLDTNNIEQIYFSKQSLGISSGNTINTLLQIEVNSIIRISVISNYLLTFEVIATDILSDSGDYYTLPCSLISENLDFLDYEGLECYITIQNIGQSGISGRSGALGGSGISGRVGINGNSGQSGQFGISGISGLSSSGRSGISGVNGGRLLYGESTEIVLTGTTTTLLASQLQTSVINIYKTNTGNHTVNLPDTPFIPYQYIKIFLRNGNTGELTLSGDNLNYNAGLTVETNPETNFYKTKMIGLIYDNRADSAEKPWILQELTDTAWDVPSGV